MSAYSPGHAFDVPPGHPQPGLLTLFFRWLLRTAKRKPAAPGAVAERDARVPADATPGAAATLLTGPYPCCFHCNAGSPCEPRDNHQDPCQEGCNDAVPVLGDGTIAEARARWDRERMDPARDALLTYDDGATVHLHPRGQHHFTERPTRLPRHDGDIVIDEWHHVHVRPVNGRYLGDLPRRTPAATLNRAPWETGAFTVPGDVTLVPVHGQAPVARVLEAERLAGVMRP